RGGEPAEGELRPVRPDASNPQPEGDPQRFGGFPGAEQVDQGAVLADDLLRFRCDTVLRRAGEVVRQDTQPHPSQRGDVGRDAHRDLGGGGGADEPLVLHAQQPARPGGLGQAPGRLGRPPRRRDTVPPGERGPGTGAARAPHPSHGALLPAPLPTQTALCGGTRRRSRPGPRDVLPEERSTVPGTVQDFSTSAARRSMLSRAPSSMPDSVMASRSATDWKTEVATYRVFAPSTSSSTAVSSETWPGIPSYSKVCTIRSGAATSWKIPRNAYSSPWSPWWVIRQEPPGRASRCSTTVRYSFGPHHCASRSGSVSARNTASRGASKTRVMTMS